MRLLTECGAVLSGLLLSVAAVAQPKQAVPPSGKPSGAVSQCREIDETIEQSLKLIADGLYGGSMDNSAPRETLRLLRATVQEAAIANAMAQMQWLGCPAISRSLAPWTYQLAAMECVVAPSDRKSEFCDHGRWRRNEVIAAEAAARPASQPNRDADQRAR